VGVILNRYRDFLLKGLWVLFAVIIINLAFWFCSDLLVWVNDWRATSLQVNAVATEDLLQYVTVLQTNPQVVKIKKAENYTGELVVCFGIEGEAAEYLAHLNPVKLDTHEEISVPLIPRVELPQFISLLTKGNNVAGTLKIKYINKFTDEAYSFSFSNEYLLGCFINNLQDGFKNDQPSSRSMSVLNTTNWGELCHLLHYVVDQTGWEAVDQILKERRNNQG
jgi:hypothetical protein